MQSLRRDYIWGCLFNAVDQVVVPVATRPNVAGVAGGAPWEDMALAVFRQKISAENFRPVTGARIPNGLQ